MNTNTLAKPLAPRLFALVIALAGSGISMFGTFAIADHYVATAGQVGTQHYAHGHRPATGARECVNVAS